MGVLSLGVIFNPDPDSAHQRKVCDVVHNASRYVSGIVLRLHTAGATRMTPSALGGFSEANAVITTAPPMLSPRTYTGSPGWRAFTTSTKSARSRRMMSLPGQIPNCGERPKL